MGTLGSPWGKWRCYLCLLPSARDHLLRVDLIQCQVGIATVHRHHQCRYHVAIEHPQVVLTMVLIVSNTFLLVSSRGAIVIPRNLVPTSQTCGTERLSICICGVWVPKAYWSFPPCLARQCTLHLGTLMVSPSCLKMKLSEVIAICACSCVWVKMVASSVVYIVFSLLGERKNDIP